MLISVDVLRAAMPRCTRPAAWSMALSDACVRYGISDRAEVAMLLAQVGHESADLTRLTENLSYTSAERIHAVWPVRFKTVASAEPYVKNPEGLANLVYADRMGNGHAESGEGWMYRGRGPLGLTGKDNYDAFDRDSGWPVLTYPDLVCDDVRIGAASACWYWRRRVKMGTVPAVTMQINGGLIGLDDRIARFDVAQKAMELCA